MGPGHCNFYIVKNHKIVNNPTTTETIEIKAQSGNLHNKLLKKLKKSNFTL
jgi:hypothetical protein